MARLHCSIHPKLTDDVLELLKKRKILTAMKFFEEPPDKMSKLTKLSFADVLEIRQKITERCGGKIQRPNEILKFYEEKVLSTGITSLDDFLNGGLHPGQIYEFCGASSSGKTQLCLTLAANISLKSNCEVYYIDTKRDFSAMRINSILESKNLNDEIIGKVMTSLHVSPVNNIWELMDALYYMVSKKTNENNEKTKLIIIDSLPSIFYVGLENQESLYYLNHLANICKYLANEFHIPIITVNLISHWRENEGFGIPIDMKTTNLKPTLGKFWSHIPNVRLLIEKSDNEKRQITMWKNHDTSTNKNIQINITNSGVI